MINKHQKAYKEKAEENEVKEEENVSETPQADTDKI